MGENNKIRVRMAPSPTGFLHIGSARTTLFNWLFAKANGGKFILRIEDTDSERSKKEFEDDIVNGLKWLGLDWDEFYCQTERLDIYEKYLKELIDSGKAFWCYHTKEELEIERKKQADRKEAPCHVCKYKRQPDFAPSELRRGEGGIIRLAVDENSTRVIHFEDEIRGVIEQNQHLLGDFSIAKDLKNPLYNFAASVDDFEMEISHVIRGEDHISNTFKQILIYEALGKTPPKFVHLPLILASDRSKLSKRNSTTALDEYKKDYLPEAILNFIGFLGYTYSKEIISKEEMVKEFNLKKIHKSGAVWNVEKLDWINAQYIKNLSPEKFKEMSGKGDMPFLAVPLITERLERLSDVNNFDFFWKEPEYDKELLKWKNCSIEEIKNSLERVIEVIEHHSFSDKNALRLQLDDLAKSLGGDRGLAYWPLRVALTGKEKSPDPVDIAYVIGKEKTLERVKAAIEK